MGSCWEPLTGNSLKVLARYTLSFKNHSHDTYKKVRECEAGAQLHPPGKSNIQHQKPCKLIQLFSFPSGSAFGSHLIDQVEPMILALSLTTDKTSTTLLDSIIHLKHTLYDTHAMLRRPCVFGNSASYGFVASKFVKTVPALRRGQTENWVPQVVAVGLRGIRKEVKESFGSANQST